MPGFAQMEQEFENLDRGAARLAGIRDAIKEADRVQDKEWMFWFRYDYIEESIFCGDRYYAVITFPEFLQIYDDTPELHENPRISHSMLVCFRWIVEAVEEFPLISKAQIDSYFRLYKRRLQELGYSLNNYYMKRSLVYMHMNMDIAVANFYRFLEEPMDSISDGKPLCQNHQVEFYLAMDAEDKALDAAVPIFSGKLKSNALPHSTNHKFCRYYLQKGNYEKAEEFARKIEHVADGDPYHMHYIGTLMSVYSLSDPAHGIALFSRNYPLYASSKNPWMRCFFEFGAAHLFARIVRDGLNTDAPQLPQGTEAAGMDTAALAAYFYSQGAASARKFDERNGTGDFTEMLHWLPVRL